MNANQLTQLRASQLPLETDPLLRNNLGLVSHQTIATYKY